MSQLLTQAQLELHHRIQTDLPWFAETFCRIIPKEGGELVPFKFTPVQMYIHKKVEKQKAEKGYVRVSIYKGRQQRCSSYVGVRFFRNGIVNKARKAYILSHESDSTETLFERIEVFYDNIPEHLLSIRPGLKTRNRSKLEYKTLSQFAVGTAGVKNTGRGKTAQDLHMSEWDHYEASNINGIKSGVLQIVSATLPGTEIIRETTANGMGWAYNFALETLAGKNDYIYIFVPWFIDKEYTAAVPKGFKRTKEEEELILKYGGGPEYRFGKDNYRDEDGESYGVPGLTTDGQLQWRRLQISELGEKLFKQEYPCYLMEAFQASADSFYDSNLIEKAMKLHMYVVPDRYSPKILGVDAGRTNDRTVLTFRQGRVVHWQRKYKKMDEMTLVGIIINIIKEEDIDRVFIDYGQAYGTIDRLRELGWGHKVTGIFFGGESSKPHYKNKRAEMHGELDDWLHDGKVKLPDDQDLMGDMMSLPEPKPDSLGRLVFVPKSEIRKNTKRSPDCLDSLALTFAEPVASTEFSGVRNTKSKQAKRTGSSLRTRQRESERSGTTDDGRRHSDDELEKHWTKRRRKKAVNEWD